VLNDVETVVAIDDSATVDQGSSVQVDVTANDQVGPLDRLDLVEVVSVSNGTASVNDAGQIEFIHDGSETASAEVVYRIVNEEGNFSTATVNLVINSIDEALVQTVPDQLELVARQRTTFSIDQILANDFGDGASLTDFRVDIVGAPSQGTVVVDDANGVLIFTPSEGFIGGDSFEYRLVSPDGAVLSEVAAVSIELVEFTPPRQLNSDAQDNTTTIPSPSRPHLWIRLTTRRRKAFRPVSYRPLTRS